MYESCVRIVNSMMEQVVESRSSVFQGAMMCNFPKG